MSKVTININDTVEVTLTEEGAAHLNANRAAFYAQYPDLGVAPQVNPGQSYSAQLWALMRDFGPVVSMGLPVPFERCKMVMEASPEVRIVDKDKPETWPPDNDFYIAVWDKESINHPFLSKGSLIGPTSWSGGDYVAWMPLPIVPRT